MDENINRLQSRGEQAHAMGINIPEDRDWGDMPSRVCGEVGGAEGGNFTRNAVKNFEQKIANMEAH